MDVEKAVCVVVDESRKIVQGLTPETTAEEVITALKGSCGKTAPQVLLETWNHCSRPLSPDLKICSLLDEWGNQAQNVKLVLVEASSHKAKSKPQASVQLHPRTRQRQVNCRKKLTHGKVSYRKRKSVVAKEMSRRTLAKDILRLIRVIETKREEYESLMSLKQPKDVVIDPSAVQPSETLSPEEEEEWMVLQEERNEEHKENCELTRRKRELVERTAAQESEMEGLKRTIVTLENKLAIEERQLHKLTESSVRSEVQETQQEVQRLQNELKVRTKVNQLQSAKMKELTESTHSVDKSINDCSELLEKLRLELKPAQDAHSIAD